MTLPKTGGSLFQEDFRRSFAEHAVPAIVLLDNGAHGLADRVEGVDLVQFLLGILVADWLVVSSQIHDEPQQGTFRLVPHLAR